MSDVYKVILVDDEDQVRGRIKSFLEERDDFVVVDSANNGVDALELVETHEPDVVITDIRMPFINGIELTKHLRRDYPNIKVAFISGYDEFEYAKEAIDLNVYTYLMKPVSQDDLHAFLDKLAATLKDEHDRLYNAERLEETYKESMPLLIENRFTALLQEDMIQDDSLDALKQFGIDLTKGQHVLGIIRFKGAKDTFLLERFRIFLRNLIPTILNHYKQVHVFQMTGNMIFLVNHPELTTRRVEDDLHAMLAKTGDFEALSMDIGVSSIFDDVRELRVKFEEAERALDYGKYSNVGPLIFYEDFEREDPQIYMISNEMISQIDNAIRFGTLEHITDLFNDIRILTNANTASWMNLRFIMVNIASMVIRYAQSLSVDLSTLMDGDMIDVVMEQRDLNDFLTFVEDMIVRIREAKEKDTAQKSNKLIYEIIQYVDTNFTKPSIQMETLCETFAISVSYLSVLFKRETGMTFHKYLTKKRMEKAKELLAYSDQRVIEVAEACGYNEVYHFSHTFKKYTGVSPKEYRHD